MSQERDVVTVNGEECFKKIKNSSSFVIVRTCTAGVFAGELCRREGKEVELRNARRIWHWKGAASLSQLAMEGTSRPSECKFPCAVASIILTEAIEIIFCSEKAQKSILEVPEWKN